MSKWTLEQVRDWHRDQGSKASANRHMGLAGMHYGMMDALAAHLAAQAEWPSEEDASRVLHSFDGSFNDGGIDYRMRLVRMRAALQSVRPPVGVSDDYKEIARLIGSIFFSGDFKAETHNERELEKLLRKTGNFYDTQEQFDDASRHAPTKD